MESLNMHHMAVVKCLTILCTTLIPVYSYSSACVATCVEQQETQLLDLISQSVNFPPKWPEKTDCEEEARRSRNPVVALGSTRLDWQFDLEYSRIYSWVCDMLRPSHRIRVVSDITNFDLSYNT
ncbi:hypothetical protein TESG_02220 [Trichophyton tonsurans CBS 112818]|uniref:Uncharacterized protein n=1 Tax=Trichophyton tonsurans (strain CBS 112818) TaxID=647933 RepID=F2RTR1_TRIT1|nr:hypothetical protein TESG_02220 [Trichophyton tonsurans CBS 112818]